MSTQAKTPAAFLQEVHASVDCSCCGTKTLVNRSEAVAFQTMNKPCPVCASHDVGIFVLTEAQHAKYNAMRGVKPTTEKEDALKEKKVHGRKWLSSEEVLEKYGKAHEDELDKLLEVNPDLF